MDGLEATSIGVQACISGRLAHLRTSLRQVGESTRLVVVLGTRANDVGILSRFVNRWETREGCDIQ